MYNNAFYKPYKNIYVRSTDSRLTDEGRLQISVFDTNQGAPVPNAQIKITPHLDITSTLDEEVSNESGRTATLNLPTPSIAYSQNPEQPEQPYSEYDVIVTAPDFRETKVEGVQIFPNSTANQKIFLQRTQIVNTDNLITISPPTLWGDFPPKTPEEEVKDIDESGFVVLPEPVVPEFIIVHAGAPTNSSAPNYWVPFSDYIKNVASCEIYSNWPEETIKANVLAIISFTLNRVFTEWYRNRGYDFTITNNTAYDQAFDYGRNIYDEISVIVDNIFNTYITKPGIRQPLFSQYCDGQRTSCPNWLSQWGSKSLGDQGYNSVDILKNFYGQDIYLMNANSVAGVPSSFPGNNLQVGSTGPSVRTIQEQLNAISNNYPAINKIRVDGIFGNGTRTAVETFQEIFNLPTSGIVDFATWYRISDIYVAVERLAAL